MQVPPFPYFFIALSMLVGFITVSFKRNNPRYLQIFPFFLMVTLAGELLGWQMGLRNHNNSAVYNYLTLVAFAYYMYLLRYVVVNLLARRIILGVIISYVIGTVTYILLILESGAFHTLTYIIGCSLIVVLSIYYFYELFQAPRAVNLMREPAFWIVIGLLFFYSSTLPVLGIVNYYPEVYMISEPVLMILNILLYSLFTIAFLCRIRYKRSIL